MMGDNSDMQGVDGCFWRKNCSGHDFVGYDTNLRFKREQWYAIEGLQPLRSICRIAIRRFINHIL